MPGIRKRRGKKNMKSENKGDLKAEEARPYRQQHAHLRGGPHNQWQRLGRTSLRPGGKKSQYSWLQSDAQQQTQGVGGEEIRQPGTAAGKK